MSYINDKQKRIIKLGIIATIIIVAIAFIIAALIGNGNKKTSENRDDEFATVSDAQRSLLADIKDSFEGGDMNKAAIIIRDNFNELENIYKLSNEQRVCIDGLLIIDRSTYYYGILEEGVPNGSGIAIRVYETDNWRYDYAKGEFQNGMLNGTATTGYSYITSGVQTTSNAAASAVDAAENEKKAKQNNVIAVERSGNFIDDIMDGNITMNIYYSDGFKAEYNIISDNGTTDISNWEYMESENKYQIRAANNSEYVYELTKDEAGQVRWKTAVAVYEGH